MWTTICFCGNYCRRSSDDKHSSSLKCKLCFTCSESAEFNCPKDSTLCFKYVSVSIPAFPDIGNWRQSIAASFANKFLFRYNEDRSYPLCTLWTDEAHFMLTGYVNSKNCVHWADNNTHDVFASSSHEE